VRAEVAVVSIDTKAGRMVRYLSDASGHFATVPQIQFPPDEGVEPEIVEDFRTNRSILPAQPPKDVA
jgi:hypothetical protein